MAASSAAASHLPPVKSVVVYRNGDPFYTGRRFVVNQRQVATMEAFLNEVTRSIRAPLAVRTLYTPKQGHRVTDLQDLQTGAQYVAAGSERFKKLDYLNAGVKKQPASREETQVKGVQKPQVTAKWREFVPAPCIIHVFRNGDLLCAPLRLIIPRSMRQDLEQILCVISEKVNLRTGAVRRLCSLEGGTVSSAGELETGHCYVAVGTERFKKLPYEALLASKATERHFPGKKRLQRRAQNRKLGSNPEDPHSDSAPHDSPESDGRRVKSTGDEAAAPHQEISKRAETEGTGVKIHKKPSQVRYPLSNGSVYSNIFQKEVQNSKEDLEGAEEVQEDENTATELPVDQIAAEIIEEEEINNVEDCVRAMKQASPQDASSAGAGQDHRPEEITASPKHSC
ncbi:doublecortin domain-containing protein 2B isoform X1 [Oryzias melastigma]|uniref:Doublecortin domain-containing protein 2-like n=1 Tax=Oryzias melastigma TaxID=30732 RepID=A0A3B3BWZ9_ORYME|nr:doublecortin domain-containing protein 2B isoform X1 [Oryzias melastigma]XP_024128627.1 doublecortin domain-containing protein 2B isoform X1 [Oryzias melastigma]XP_024128636.1 doublecortin domain-containing protein 2B isoform X1 [Oryzias melastigma]